MKGSMLDMVVVCIMILSMAIAMVLGHTLSLAFTDQFDGMGINSTYMQEQETAILGFDAYLVMVVFSVGIVTIISAFFIQTHPVFFIVSLFAMIFMGVISAIASNVYGVFATNPQVIASASNFTYTDLIFANLPSIVIVFTIISGVVAYGKWRSEPQQII